MNLPPLAPDYSGACSALFNLDSTIVIHDASGCTGNYGERNEADGRRMRSLAYRTALVVSAVCMAAVFLAREKVDVLFGASETANAGVAQVLPYFLSTLLFLAFVRITTSCFYATEKTRLSYILVYAEPVCTLLFLLTLPLGLKLTGVWLAVPLAQTAAFLIALLAKRRVERV